MNSFSLEKVKLMLENVVNEKGGTGYNIKSKIYKKFTKKRYSEVLKYNTSQITNIMHNLPELAMGGFFASFLLMPKTLFIIFSLTTFLFFINFKVTFFIFLITSVVLILLFIF